MRTKRFDLSLIYYEAGKELDIKLNRLFALIKFTIQVPYNETPTSFKI